MARMAAAVYGLDDRLDFVSGHELDEASAQPIPAEMLGRHPSTANTNSSTPPQKRRQTLREVARGFGRALHRSCGKSARGWVADLKSRNRALTSDRIRTRNRHFPDRKYAYFGSDGERGKGGA
jgi:hypothetical protein